MKILLGEHHQSAPATVGIRATVSAAPAPPSYSGTSDRRGRREAAAATRGVAPAVARTGRGASSGRCKELDPELQLVNAWVRFAEAAEGLTIRSWQDVQMAFLHDDSPEAAEARRAGKGSTIVAVDRARVAALPDPEASYASIIDKWKRWCRAAKQVGGFGPAQTVLTNWCGARSPGAKMLTTAAPSRALDPHRPAVSALGTSSLPAGRPPPPAAPTQPTPAVRAGAVRSWIEQSSFAAR